MMKNRYLVVALMSVSLISLELAWTRIFSAEFFYTFAFLVLSLAVLGLGLGALAVRLFSFLDRDNLFGVYLSLTGLAALVGPILVFQLGLDFSKLFSDLGMVGKFLVTVILLNAAFFWGGIALAMLFKRNHADMPRVYMFDLVGAGIGVLVGILVMNLVGTPAATFLCALPVLLAAFITSPRMMKILPLVLAAAVIAVCPYAESLLEAEREERAPVIYKHWDAMSKIKVYEFSPEYYGLNIDNEANSPVLRFDGNWNRPDSELFGFNIPVDYLIRQFDSCVFLSLGAGGGGDVLQALQFGAKEVHAVEVNDYINTMMTEGFLADFSGHIYADPRVTVATEDARAYVRRYPHKFDVIYSLSSNTFAALASGSFALAENYLFTTEAFEDYWNALTDSGFMMMEHQFYMPRLVTEIMDALHNVGVQDVTSHFAVYDLPQLRRKAVVISKRPMDDSLRYHAIIDLTPEAYEYIRLAYPATDSLKNKATYRIVTEGWQHLADSLPLNLAPATDNKPFVAQMGLWRNLDFGKLDTLAPYEFAGFPLAKVIIVIILLVVGLLILPINLLPYLLPGDRLKAIPWLYFFAIGMAFMAVEVILIQQFTLFIGASVYSIATILLTLLVASGIGSLNARRFGDSVPFLGILAWIVLDILLFAVVARAFGGLIMPVRILIAALLVFPLGFFMGMPFPKATLRVGPLVDWGFAVNGAASVLGSTAVMLVAFVTGYGVALAVGAALYLVSWRLLAAKSSW
jgi:hypothetical protein